MEVIPARLLARNGPLAGTIYPLFEGITAIGRGPKGEAEHSPRIECESTGVSRSHALFHAKVNEFAIQDAGSVNGTFIRGFRLLPEQWYGLEIGDTFELGRLSLYVLDGDQDSCARELGRMSYFFGLRPMTASVGRILYRGLCIEMRTGCVQGTDRIQHPDGSWGISEPTLIEETSEIMITRLSKGQEPEILLRVESLVAALTKIDARVSGGPGT